ncbi:MAG: imidazole glycerol phosphate synthase subunit HisF, partial [Candidatus Kryptoniota bacterium]
MLAKRIIPCLDVSNGRVVKGIHFENLKDAGDPVESAMFYEAEGADEIIFLDINATIDNRKIMLDVVRRTAENVFLPFTVGGGVRSVDDIREILASGADKVSLNTAAVQNPDLIRYGAEEFGVQCIVVAIDAKKVQPDIENNNDFASGYQVFVGGGKIPVALDAVDWAKYAVELGAGEILLTSIDRDGTNEGYDVELLQKVAGAVNVPLIASGG